MEAHYRIDNMRKFWRGFKKHTGEHRKLGRRIMNKWFKNKWKTYVNEVMPIEE
jgi:hypothetical protein